MIATATRVSPDGPSTRRWGFAAVIAVTDRARRRAGCWAAAARPCLSKGWPDPGAWTRWGLPVTKAILDGAAAVTVGLLLLAMLLPAPRGELGADALQALRAA